ncbi:hypothetical protein Trydic_g5120 [Trypoxylus dichotomus]
MVEGDTSPKKNIVSDVNNSANFNGSSDLKKKISIDPEKAGVVCEKADFEGAIENTGYGLFHYILLAVCGLVSTSEEMDVISMSFILPSAECDLNLTTQNKGWLNSIIFVGMMVGAYAWGSVADALGRKKVLIVISFMNALCIVASSFSQTYEMFMLFRFLNGAALGGSGPVIWSYFAEFQPKSKRGSMLSFMAAFWTLDEAIEIFRKIYRMNTGKDKNLFHIGYYGLMMWFPELFNRFDEYARYHPGATAGVCEVTYYVVHSESHVKKCSGHIESAVFMESLVSLASAIPANIVAILGMDRLGRKFFLVFSTVTSGICSACMYLVVNKTQNFIISAIFSGVISCGNAALDCLITEIFPTNLRATGIAISMVAARLGGIIVSALLIGGGLLCLFLPNTTRTPLS